MSDKAEQEVRSGAAGSQKRRRKHVTQVMYGECALSDSAHEYPQHTGTEVGVHGVPPA